MFSRAQMRASSWGVWRIITGPPMTLGKASSNQTVMSGLADLGNSASRSMPLVHIRSRGFCGQSVVRSRTKLNEQEARQFGAFVRVLPGPPRILAIVEIS
jgi:hypothetical protein